MVKLLARLADGGVRSILNYGPGEEELVRTAEAASGGTAQAMSFSVTELIALTRRARTFIGGDTGPLHLAAALRVPVVAIFGPTDPARNGPYGTQQCRAAQCGERYFACAAGGGGRGIVGDWK